MTEVNFPGNARGLMIAVAEGDDASAEAMMSAYITELPTGDRVASDVEAEGTQLLAAVLGDLLRTPRR